MSHGREGREGRRGQACTGVIKWNREAERTALEGPLKSAYQERGMGPGSMEPWDHRGP